MQCSCMGSDLPVAQDAGSVAFLLAGSPMKLYRLSGQAEEPGWLVGQCGRSKFASEACALAVPSLNSAGMAMSGATDIRRNGPTTHRCFGLEFQSATLEKLIDRLCN